MADLLKRLQLSKKQYGVGMEENPFADKSPSECMTLNFGGGGSPPPPPAPSSVTQQTANIPEYFQPYLERLFERAEGVTTEPFEQYEGPRLAAPTTQQQAAYQGVEDMVGGYKPYIQTADLLTAQAAQQSTDPQAIASRMSPYQQSVIDIQKREALRDTEKLQQQLGASAVGAGAYGGSRQALLESELGRQTGQRLADIQATGSQQAYQQAANQLQTDRAASLASGQQFAGLGAQQQQLGLAGMGALETIGGTQQAQQQRAFDIAYEDFARERTMPSQQVQEMSSVLRGFNLPVSTYQTSQQNLAPPSFAQQAAGVGLGALGVYGAGKGVGLFAEGGSVPDNPGIKKLAEKAPQVVENMGYNPDEVIAAYMGGQMGVEKFKDKGIVEGSQKYETRQGSMFTPIRRFDDRKKGDRVDSEGNPLPGQIGPEFFESMEGQSLLEYLNNKENIPDAMSREEAILERQKNLEKLEPSFGGKAFMEEYKIGEKLFQDDISKNSDDDIAEIMNTGKPYDRLGVERFTDADGNFVMPLQKAKPRVPLTKNNRKILKEQAKANKAFEEALAAGKTEKEALVIANKVDPTFSTSNNKTDGSKTTPDPTNVLNTTSDGEMTSLLKQKILGEINREDEDLDRFRRAAGYLDIAAKGFDAFTGASGREQAREDISSAVKTASTMEDQDRKARTADIGLLNIGAQLELEENKLATSRINQVAKNAAAQLKLDFGATTKFIETILKNQPELYTKLGSTDPTIVAQANETLMNGVQRLLITNQAISGGLVSNLSEAAEQSGEAIGTVGGVEATVRGNIKRDN